GPTSRLWPNETWDRVHQSKSQVRRATGRTSRRARSTDDYARTSSGMDRVRETPPLESHPTPVEGWRPGSQAQHTNATTHRSSKWRNAAARWTPPCSPAHALTRYAMTPTLNGQVRT